MLLPHKALAASFSYEYLSGQAAVVQSTGLNDSVYSGFPSGTVTDALGDFYVFGDFTGTIDFDRSSAVDEHTSSGTQQNAFITKINKNGSYAWTKTLLTPGNIRATGAAIDSTNNLYVVGYYSGTVDLNTGMGVAEVTAPSDSGYILKLDSNGNYTQHWDSPSHIIDTIHIDAIGSIFLGGRFYGTDVDINPGTGVQLRTGIAGLTASIIKMTSNMEHMWSHTWNHLDRSTAIRQVSTAPNGEVIINFNISPIAASYDIDPTAGDDVRAFNIQQRHAISNFTANGEYQWSRLFGDMSLNSTDGITGMVVSSEGIFFSGVFHGSPDFDNTAGSDVRSRVGAGTRTSGDKFITKYNLDGSYGWSKIWDGRGERIYIALDSYGYLYALTGYRGTIDLNPDSGVTSITADGTTGVSLSRFESATGTFVDHQLFDGPGDELSGFLSFGPDNILRASVFSNGVLDLNPTTGTDSVDFNTKYGTAHIMLNLNYRFTGTPLAGLIARVVSTNDNTATTGAPRSASSIIRISTDSNKPIVQFNANMTQDRDWTSIMAQTDLANFKSVTTGVATADGVSGTHSLFVPKRPGDNVVYICPNATMLNEVSATCQNVEQYKQGDSNVQVVTIDGQEYWLISGLTGTGGQSGLVQDSTTLAETGVDATILIGLFASVSLVAVYALSPRNRNKRYALYRR